MDISNRSFKDLRGGSTFGPVKYMKEVSHVKHMHADSLLVHSNFFSKLMITWLINWSKTHFWSAFISLSNCFLFSISKSFCHYIKIIIGPILAPWSGWSSCSKTCGNGTKTQTRTCIAYCSSVSSSDLIRTQTCNEGGCKFFIWKYFVIILKSS